MLLSQLGRDALVGSDIELFQVDHRHLPVDYVKWMRDAQVQKFLESRLDEHDPVSLKRFLSRCEQSPGILMLGIRRRDTQAHIGNIKLEWNLHHRVGSVGIMIGEPSSWGLGFAPQAIRLLCQFGFTDLNLRKITAGIYDGHRRSLGAFQRVGFQVEAILKDHVLLDDQATDVKLLALFRRDATRLMNHAGESDAGPT
jgi:RimJ/RimL family protein N-acetyltransferase